MFEDDEAFLRELKSTRIAWAEHNYETRCRRPDFPVMPSKGKRGRPAKKKAVRANG